ncbi:hypothetical protein [Rhodoferax sp. TH121]|uniref:hypothetical protein n=1 Tax=Rhodoferax sp. TH121 TaxID=2022803 RepID=UPI001595CFE0|nr:hypothetical protein [Rhodoferax sp. TH121]
MACGGTKAFGDAVFLREKCLLRRLALFLCGKLEFPLRLENAVLVELGGVLR